MQTSIYVRFIKRLIFLYMIGMSTISTNAQVVSGERRVYYLDATYSMVTNKLWEPCKENLIKAVNSVNDVETELVIVVFADDKDPERHIWHVWEDVATDMGKQNLIEHIKGIQTPVKSSMTNLYRPLVDFYQQQKPDKVNYMFLMTDGGHEQGGDFNAVIDQWNVKTSNLTYGFFVELTEEVSSKEKSARDEARKHIDTQEQLWRVASADVNINLIRLESKATFNIRNDKFIDIKVYFSGEESKMESLLNSLDFSINDPAFCVVKEEISEDNIRLYINTSVDQTLYPEEVSKILNVILNGDDKSFLLTSQIDLTIINAKERTMFFSANELFGKTTHYNAFGWVDAQTIPFESHLDLTFSPDAVADTMCFAKFVIVDKKGVLVPPATMTVSINGQTCVENKFVITPKDGTLDLRIVFADNAKSGTHQYYLRLTDYKLDRIGNTSLKNAGTPDVLKLRVRYDYLMNPLKKRLIYIAIAIITALFFWFLVVKPIKYPRFPQFRKTMLVRQNDHIINQRTVNFKGARRVVFATKKVKQGFLNRLFTGRIDTIVHPTFTAPITFVPRKKKRAMVVGVGYMITPNPIPQSGVAKIINPTTKIEINLN